MSYGQKVASVMLVSTAVLVVSAAGFAVREACRFEIALEMVRSGSAFEGTPDAGVTALTEVDARVVDWQLPRVLDALTTRGASVSWLVRLGATRPQRLREAMLRPTLEATAIRAAEVTRQLELLVGLRRTASLLATGDTGTYRAGQLSVVYGRLADVDRWQYDPDMPLDVIGDFGVVAGEVAVIADALVPSRTVSGPRETVRVASRGATFDVAIEALHVSEQSIVVEWEIVGVRSPSR